MCYRPATKVTPLISNKYTKLTNFKQNNTKTKTTFTLKQICCHHKVSTYLFQIHPHSNKFWVGLGNEEHIDCDVTIQGHHGKCHA